MIAKGLGIERSTAITRRVGTRAVRTFPGTRSNGTREFAYLAAVVFLLAGRALSIARDARKLKPGFLLDPRTARSCCSSRPISP